MTDNTKELMDKEELEPTDDELEVAALMEEIGLKTDTFVALDKYNVPLANEIDELIKTFMKFTKTNVAMGKAVGKRWRKIKQNKKAKK